ncbi:hypothetical protein Clacol_007626 [Clathrus columnatus]|uniref:Uncharacterized protein n=1 Tax=Clathrus columnatus TaxID=1419009 RepID=A0AAV5AKZ5_9AGAM|nr:hypothetical protein Clacol_007626 [Clathrus columnatus]
MDMTMKTDDLLFNPWVKIGGDDGNESDSDKDSESDSNKDSNGSNENRNENDSDEGGNESDLDEDSNENVPDEDSNENAPDEDGNAPGCMKCLKHIILVPLPMLQLEQLFTPPPYSASGCPTTTSSTKSLDK